MTAPRDPFSDNLITIRTAADLLAMVPYCLGFPPEESIVVMSIRGSDGPSGLGMVARMDLRGLDADPAAAAGLAGHLLRDGAARVFVALYSERVQDDVTRWAHQVLETLDEVGLPILECLHVTSDSWRSLLCEDETCCPPQGTSVGDVASSSIGPEMVVRGASVLPTREDRVAFTTIPDLRRAEWVTRRAGLALADGGPSTAALGHAFGTWRRLVAAAQESRAHGTRGQQASESQLARLAAAIHRVRFRDALLIDAVVDWADPYTTLERHLDDLAGVFDGGSRPQSDRLDAVREVLAQVVRATTGPFRADSLAALAWIEWYSGDLSMARDLAELALNLEPSQSMAGLVFELGQAGLPPRWAQPPLTQPPVAWPA